MFVRIKCKGDVKMPTVNAVCECLPQNIRREIESIRNKENIEEIRLRANKPLSVTVQNTSYYVNRGALSETDFAESILISHSDIEFAVKRFCRESVYAHINEIKRGYIAAAGGLRIGVAGNFGGENVTEFSSLNIRLPHEILGAADLLISKNTGGGILIAGAPGCGKTTVLRDAVRQLSNLGHRVSVIDTRGEISGGNTDGGMDTGRNTDIFLNCEKAFGIEACLRVFSPQYIAFDEIGTMAELEAARQSFSGGAEIITTAHAGSVSDFSRRKVLRELILSGAVKTAVFMTSRNLADALFFNTEELKKCL